MAIEASNPASKPAAELAKAAEARRRIPMSVPTRKMEVPEIVGFRMYWFVEENVPRAIQAGYEFVNQDEVPLHQRNVATASSVSGNADLGSQIRLIAGVDEGGKMRHQVLMKIRNEWYEEDKAALEQKNAQIMRSIFQNEEILGADKYKGSDLQTAYVDKDRTNVTGPKTKALFNRPARKGSK
jgi:hypothetical protein